jgi:hypothetical protein
MSTTTTFTRRGLAAVAGTVAFVAALAMAPAASADRVLSVTDLIDQAIVEGAGGEGCNGAAGGVGPALSAAEDEVSNFLKGDKCPPSAKAAVRKSAKSNNKRGHVVRTRHR